MDRYEAGIENWSFIFVMSEAKFEIRVLLDQANNSATEQKGGVQVVSLAARLNCDAMLTL